MSSRFQAHFSVKHSIDGKRGTNRVIHAAIEEKVKVIKHDSKNFVLDVCIVHCPICKCEELQRQTVSLCSTSQSP